MYIHVHVFIYVCVNTVYVHVYSNIYTYMYTCIYIYVYNIHTHKHMYGVGWFFLYYCNFVDSLQGTSCRLAHVSLVVHRIFDPLLALVEQGSFDIVCLLP